MTTIENRPQPCVLTLRSEREVLLDQQQGIAAWTRAHPTEPLSHDGSLSREARVDRARNSDVVQRQRQALVDWSARQMKVGTRRVVLVHRNDWFKQKVTTALEDAGIAVVADLENGADAIGVVVAEQPDVVLVQDKLPMTTGLDVLKAVREFAPNSVVLAQVEGDADIAPFLEAGARKAYPRRVPPADIAADVRAFFGF